MRARAEEWLRSVRLSARLGGVGLLGLTVLLSSCERRLSAHGDEPLHSVTFSSWDKGALCPGALENEAPDQYAARVYAGSRLGKNYEPPNIYCIGKAFDEPELQSFDAGGDLAAKYYLAVAHTVENGDMCGSIQVSRGAFLRVIHNSNCDGAVSFCFAEAPHLLAAVEKNCNSSFDVEKLEEISRNRGFDYGVYINSRGE